MITTGGARISYAWRECGFTFFTSMSRNEYVSLLQVTLVTYTTKINEHGKLKMDSLEEYQARKENEGLVTELP